MTPASTHMRRVTRIPALPRHLCVCCPQRADFACDGPFGTVYACDEHRSLVADPETSERALEAALAGPTPAPAFGALLWISAIVMVVGCVGVVCAAFLIEIGRVRGFDMPVEITAAGQWSADFVAFGLAAFALLVVADRIREALRP